METIHFLFQMHVKSTQWVAFQVNTDKKHANRQRYSYSCAQLMSRDIPTNKE